MKKIILLFVAIILIACLDKPKNYVTFSGKINNKNSDSLLIRTDNYLKTIKVNPDGTFSDTLQVKPSVYNLFDGKKSTFIFLRNGFELNMNLDTEDFYKSIEFTGKGADHSNFIAKNNVLNQELLNLNELIQLKADEVPFRFETIKQKLLEFYDANKNIDTMVTNRLRENLDPMLNYHSQYVIKTIVSKIQLKEGMKAPVFKNYENFNGGTTSLTDFKGKYVYIDVWATWCRPCLAEIPALKQLEKAYHGKDIEFVSISVDDGRGYRGGTSEESKALAKKAWKEMVASKALSGTQIIAPNGWQSQFIQEFKIKGIPRFILIDPNGKIATPNAPRPSSKKEISKLFNQLGI